MFKLYPRRPCPAMYPLCSEAYLPFLSSLFFLMKPFPPKARVVAFPPSVIGPNSKLPPSPQLAPPGPLIELTRQLPRVPPYPLASIQKQVYPYISSRMSGNVTEFGFFSGREYLHIPMPLFSPDFRENALGHISGLQPTPEATLSPPKLPISFLSETESFLPPSSS